MATAKKLKRLGIPRSSHYDLGYGPWRTTEVGPRKGDLYVRGEPNANFIEKEQTKGNRFKFRPAYVDQTTRTPYKESTQIFSGQQISGAWYPAHMARESLKIRKLIDKVDIILDVRDARAPLSTANHFIADAIPPDMERIVILNKADLAPHIYLERTLELFRSQGITTFPTSCNGTEGFPPIVQHIYNCKRGTFVKSVGQMVMVVGVPNVGKTAVINKLRRKAYHDNTRAPGMRGYNKDYGRLASSVEDCPGSTQRCLMNVLQKNRQKKIFIIDTPGIMLPQMSDPEVVYKLAALHCMPDPILGAPTIADYVLHYMNTNKYLQYVDTVGLDQPCEDVTVVCEQIANRMDLKSRGTTLRAATNLGYAHFLKMFRTGFFDRVTLDIIPDAEDVGDCTEFDMSEPPGPWSVDTTQPLRGLV